MLKRNQKFKYKILHDIKIQLFYCNNLVKTYNYV